MKNPPFAFLYSVGLLRRELPDFAECYMDAALAGDTDAAESLVFAAPNAMRPALACLFWRRRIPDAAYRAVLANVWNHDHHYLLDQVTRQQVVAMFRAAQFPTDHLPATVRIWRGTSRVEQQTSTGLSWTLRRDIACWFATTWMMAQKAAGRLRVVTAEVPRSAVLMHHTDRNEEEVVCVGVKRATVDGTAEDWLARGAAYQSGRGLVLNAPPSLLSMPL